MASLNIMQDFLIKSGISTELYTLENAKEFASLIIGLYDTEELDSAVKDAIDEQMNRQETGRLQVFIGCDYTINPRHVEDCLVKPHEHIFKRGSRNEQKEIYGKRDEAYNGRNKSGEPHSAFFVYDTNAAVMADFIGKNGESLLSRAVRNTYLSALESSLRYSVAREEAPLGSPEIEDVRV